AGLAGRALGRREPRVEEELLAELDLAYGDGVVGRSGDLHVLQALGWHERRDGPGQRGDPGGGVRRRRQAPVDQARVPLVERADVGEQLPHMLVGEYGEG